jgi:hypothetical protein
MRSIVALHCPQNLLRLSQALLIGGWSLVVNGAAVQADQTPPPLPPLQSVTAVRSATLKTIELPKFRRGICPDGSPGSSDRDIKAAGVTIPSLWWTRDQLVAKPYFNPKLIEGWLVCDAGIQDQSARVCKLAPQRPGRVDILVNSQLWSVLDYLNRYEFLNRLGTAASECGYNIYVFNTEAKLLSDYTCAFPDRPDQCKLRTDPTGRGGLRRGPTDVFAPTTNGTAPR